MIEINNLSKIFTTEKNKAVITLSNISLRIRKGKFIALVGPSGCGKTTLLKLLAGLIKPTQGKIIVKGEKLKDSRRSCGFIFQDYSLFPWLNIEQNILLGNNNPKLLNKYLKLARLNDYREFYPKDLSGGMRQRVAILRSIIQNPDFILMDEPFSALDVETKNRIQKILLNLWQKSGQTILFVTHDIEEAIFLADEIVVLSDKPTTIKAKIDIKFSRPRRGDLRYDKEFVELRKKINDLIYHE